MKCSSALRLAALHIQERIYACAQPQKISLKYIEWVAGDFGVPPTAAVLHLSLGWRWARMARIHTKLTLTHLPICPLSSLHFPLHPLQHSLASPRSEPDAPSGAQASSRWNDTESLHKFPVPGRISQEISWQLQHQALLRAGIPWKFICGERNPVVLHSY